MWSFKKEEKAVFVQSTEENRIWIARNHVLLEDRGLDMANSTCYFIVARERGQSDEAVAWFQRMERLVDHTNIKRR
jgi:hypothetical protein